MYLDEAFPSSGSRLMPDSALQRAQMKIAMDLCTYLLAPIFFRMVTQGDDVPTMADLLDKCLNELGFQLGQASRSGPYWFGEQFTLVDIVFFPFLDRFVLRKLFVRSDLFRLKVLKVLCGYSVPEGDTCTDRVKRWIEALASRPSLQQVNTFAKIPEKLVAVCHLVLFVCFP
jgi:glutathione S-transferase